VIDKDEDDEDVTCLRSSYTTLFRFNARMISSIVFSYVSIVQLCVCVCVEREREREREREKERKRERTKGITRIVSRFHPQNITYRNAAELSRTKVSSTRVHSDEHESNLYILRKCTCELDASFSISTFESTH